MSRLEEKSNNEILLEIKQLQVEHENLKLSLLKDYDKIEELKVKMKKDFGKLEIVEGKFSEGNAIIVKRLKGEE
tara:strand:+ start:314 stop:535 length:222 start_codon:yes stop_codon:yes gene_type:complete